MLFFPVSFFPSQVDTAADSEALVSLLCPWFRGEGKVQQDFCQTRNQYGLKHKIREATTNQRPKPINLFSVSTRCLDLAWVPREADQVLSNVAGAPAQVPPMFPKGRRNRPRQLDPASICLRHGKSGVGRKSAHPPYLPPTLGRPCQFCGSLQMESGTVIRAGAMRWALNTIGNLNST